MSQISIELLYQKELVFIDQRKHIIIPNNIEVAEMVIRDKKIMYILLKVINTQVQE